MAELRLLGLAFEGVRQQSEPWWYAILPPDLAVRYLWSSQKRGGKLPLFFSWLHELPKTDDGHSPNGSCSTAGGQAPYISLCMSTLNLLLQSKMRDKPFSPANERVHVFTPDNRNPRLLNTCPNTPFLLR